MDTSQCLIPKFVHFVNLVQPGNESVPLLHFAAVASARAILRPDKVVLHVNGAPRGPWWDRTVPLVDELRRVDLPTHWRHLDKPIHYYAHRADHVLMHVFGLRGRHLPGPDTIAVRPLDDLLHHQFVMGREPPSPSGPGCQKLCNAVVMAAPRAGLLAEWRRR